MRRENPARITCSLPFAWILRGTDRGMGHVYVSRADLPVAYRGCVC